MLSWLILIAGFFWGQWVHTQSQMVNAKNYNPALCQNFAEYVLPYDAPKQVDLCADIVSFANNEDPNPNNKKPSIATTRTEICAVLRDVMHVGDIPYKMVPYANLYMFQVCR
jgi:hypothetical protein